MAQKRNNDNLKKKLAADGGSVPSKVKIVEIYKDFNLKTHYFTNMLNNAYENVPEFYLQRHEFNWLKDILFKDCVWCVNAPIFEYAGVKHTVAEHNLELGYQDLIRINKVFVFYGIERGNNGDLFVYGKYL